MEYYKKLYEKGKISSPILPEIANAIKKEGMMDTFHKFVVDNNTLEPRFLTLTFRNNFFNKFKNDDDVIMHRYINDKISRSNYWKKAKYIIRPEYDKNGRYHLHGLLYIKSIIDLSNIVKWWKRNFGFVNRNWNEDIRYLKCDNWKYKIYSNCSWQLQIEKRQKYQPCWCVCHYLFKDYNKTGLWTIFKLD